MGAKESWIRQDDKAGSVDLSVLALPEGDFDRPDSVSFLTKTGLWYTFKPLPETELTRSGEIFPLNFKRTGQSGPFENILDAVISMPKEIKKWVNEGRHFPHIGRVALLNETVREGDTLTINGIETSPLDIAWVTERIDPESGEQGGYGYGRLMPDGSTKLIMTKTVANF